jgi:hypothetical protein
MRRPSNVAIVSLALWAASGSIGCETKVCPTIGCEPIIEVNVQGERRSSYELAVTVSGMTFTASCPSIANPPPNHRIPGIASCSQGELEIVGVNFGEAADRAIDIQVRMDDDPAVKVRAGFDGIGNSIECDLVCSRHRGFLTL